MKAKTIGFFTVILILLIVLAACNSTNEETVSGNDHDQESNNEMTDGELKVAITAQPPTLDTHMTTSTMTEIIAKNIFEPLVTINSQHQPVPMLAESVEMSEDGKTYTFKLREGITFHNGNEMTAEDVKASMDRWMDITMGGKSMGNATFEEKDPYTVVLTLEEPMVDVLDVLADNSQIPAIMPKEIIESAGSEGVTEYIGTGPFKFVEWQQDQNIHVTKFEEYQPLDSPADGFGGKKEALVNDIFFEIVTDPSTRIAGIQTGEYDILTEASYDHYEQLKSDPNVKTHITRYGSMFAVYNKKSGIFTDVKFRQAVNAALDSDSIMKAAFVHEDLYSLDGGYMAEDQKDWYSEEGKESYNQADPDKAKQLLEEAGYNDEVVTILVSRDYAHHYNGAVVMKEQLDQIGLNTELEVYDWPTSVELREDPEEWDLYIGASSIPATPTNLAVLSSDWVGWTDDTKLSDLLEKVKRSTDKEEAKQYWDEVQGYVWNDYLPASMFGQYNKVPVTTNKVEGFSEFKGGIFWNTKIVE